MDKKPTIYRLLGLAIMLMLVASSVKAQRVDTLYYDSNWQRTNNPLEAEYVRYATYSPNPFFASLFKSYTRNGNLYSEGEFFTLNEKNDSLSRFGNYKIYYTNGRLKKECRKEGNISRFVTYDEDGAKTTEFSKNEVGNLEGLCVTYYKNGNPSIKSVVHNGNCDGEYVEYYENGQVKIIGQRKGDQLDGWCNTYYENGLLRHRCFYKDGKIDGVYSEFDSNGSFCLQAEMKDGEFAKPYYVCTTKEGGVTKYRLSDNTLFFDQPTAKDMKYFSNRGSRWYYYDMNGLKIYLRVYKSEDYGNYYVANITVVNTGTKNVEFDPRKIRVHVENVKGDEWFLHVWTAEEYLFKVKENQKVAYENASIAATQAMMNAGKSTITNNSNNSASGAAVGATSGNAAAIAVGPGCTAAGVASYSAVGAAAYSANSSSNSTTVIYDARQAFQERMAAQQQLNDFAGELDEELTQRDAGYMKLTTIMPGESVSGYVMIDYAKKLTSMNVQIPLDNIFYPFNLNLN